MFVIKPQKLFPLENPYKKESPGQKTRASYAKSFKKMLIEPGTRC
jgi:hypothetical protein